MLSVNPNTEVTLPKPLDLFSNNPVTVGYNDASFVSYTSISNAGSFPVVFSIPTGNTYISLKDSYLTMLLRVTKKTTVENADKTKTVKITNLTATDKAGFINNVSNSVMKTVKFSINSKCIENCDNYSYKSYLINMLNLRNRSKAELESAGYIHDEDSQLSGKAFDKRKSFFYNDSYEFCTKLDIDFWQQNKLLLPNLMLSLEINPNNTAFCLLGDNQNITYSLVDIRLYLYQITLLPSLSLEIEKRLANNQLATYPFDRYLIRNFFISGQRYEASVNLFNSICPNAIYIGFVDSHAYNGNFALSPYNFEHANLRSVTVNYNGRVMPSWPIKIAYDRNRYSHSFFELVRSTPSADITLEQFKNHSAIYSFNLDIDSDSNTQEPTKVGATMISVNFDVAVREHGLQMIVLSKFKSNISFDCNRELITPFGGI
uniref:Uncharacterized protein n=1 Tax=Panagrolaimus superbus TaxID=310955 RepID=A0A914YN18_9BILA